MVGLLAIAGSVVFSSAAASAAAPPTIDSEAAASVTSSGATLDAQINPQAADTAYHFEYGTSASYGTSVPVPDADAGSGASDVAVSAHVQSLRPSTTYQYRVVASNVSGTVQGPERAFTTQASEGGFALPDSRAWEMVSPPNKSGARLEAITNEGGVIQASEDGAAITYVANAPIVPEPPSNVSPQETQIISSRRSGGWESRDIATPHSGAVGVIPGSPAEYLFFSPDLSLALIEPKGDTALSPEVSERTMYLRGGLRNEVIGGYLPLVTAANVTPSTHFGYQISFVGATADLSHVVLTSLVTLTSQATESGGLYEWAAGRLQLVSVLPTGEPAPNLPAEVGLGDHNQNIRHAISNDGSRILWTEHSGQHHLYMRDVRVGKTLQLDAAQGTVEPPEGEARFQTASSDGSSVFFTDGQRLTAESTAGGSEKRDLYEFNVNSGKLTDLTVDLNAGETAEVQGVLPGTSEDGSYVYFVARGVLATTENGQKERALSGANNLYMLHRQGTEWKTTFIAGLSNEDEHDWAAEPAAPQNLTLVTSRVSPGARYFAFMSDRSLTGYDNIDANSGVADEEVFLYDANAGRLVCASCNPTGARPVGVLDAPFASGEGVGLLVDRPKTWAGRWLAGSIPGWTSVDIVRALSQSRYLSDSGRLFFNSADALVPQDTNGKEDVYEYEPAGVGGCERAGGCVALISSGTAGSESAFLDASADGSDAFFLTASQLVSQDIDTSFDVYDAHVCSASASCFTPSNVPPPACTTGDSCKSPPSSQPDIFGAPASATFSGGGNLAPPPVPKALTNAQKLAKALQACRKKPKKKRLACQKHARRAYGAVHRAKKSHKGR
jgi:hypothetical protein